MDPLLHRVPADTADRLRGAARKAGEDSPGPDGAFDAVLSAAQTRGGASADASAQATIESAPEGGARKASGAGIDPAREIPGDAPVEHAGHSALAAVLAPAPAVQVAGGGDAQPAPGPRSDIMGERAVGVASADGQMPPAATGEGSTPGARTAAPNRASAFGAEHAHLTTPLIPPRGDAALPAMSAGQVTAPPEQVSTEAPRGHAERLNEAGPSLAQGDAALSVRRPSETIGDATPPRQSVAARPPHQTGAAPPSAGSQSTAEAGASQRALQEVASDAAASVARTQSSRDAVAREVPSDAPSFAADRKLRLAGIVPGLGGSEPAASDRAQLISTPLRTIVEPAPPVIAATQGTANQVQAGPPDGQPGIAARSMALTPMIERSLLPQIVSGAGALQNGGVVELMLDPPELGRIEIALEISEKAVRATLGFERAATGEFVRRHADQLLQQFKEAGFADVELSFAQQDGMRGEDDPADPGAPDGARDVPASPSHRADASRPRLVVSASGIDLRY